MANFIPLALKLLTLWLPKSPGPSVLWPSYQWLIFLDSTHHQLRNELLHAFLCQLGAELWIFFHFFCCGAIYRCTDYWTYSNLNISEYFCSRKEFNTLFSYSFSKGNQWKWCHLSTMNIYYYGIFASSVVCVTISPTWHICLSMSQWCQYVAVTSICWNNFSISFNLTVNLVKPILVTAL